MVFTHCATVTTAPKIIGDVLPINNSYILPVLNTPTCNINNTFSLKVTLVANVTVNDTTQNKTIYVFSGLRPI